MTRVIRIAFVVHTFDLGGLERFVAHLVNGLDHKRFWPLVFCLDRNGDAGNWIDRGSVPIVELNKRSGNDLSVVRRLAVALKEHCVDIVQSHNWGTLIETTMARRKARIPLHIHMERGTVLGQVEARGLRSRIRALAMKWALRRVDVVASNAVSVAQRIQNRCGFPAEMVHVIPNGVRAPEVSNVPSARRQVRQELCLSNDAFVVGSVGRLQTVKGFPTAIEAIAQVAERGVDIHLLLVGDGPQRDALIAKAASLAVSHRVHLVGLQEDVGRWLTAMDVYLNASLSEGMSHSIVEAMAAGLPMVVTDVGDNRLLVEGADPCGLVVGAADAAALAEAIESLHRQPSQRSRYSRLASIRHADRYSCEKMYQSYESLYGALVGRAGF